MPFNIASWPLALHLLVFALAAAVIWRAGTTLSRTADVVSDRTGLGRAFIGLTLLAFATSLPELATTATAASIGEPALASGNLLGGIVLQTVVLVLADFASGRRALTARPVGAGVLLQAAMLIVLLAIALAATVFGEVALPLDVGLWTAGLFAAYLVGVYLVRSQRDRGGWRPVGQPDEREEAREPVGVEVRRLRQRSTRAVAGMFLAAAIAVLVAGVIVTQTADALAVALGLGTGFVGATFLALSTSLPEVSTTLAAVRIGAAAMAMGNVFGSNMLMIAFLFVADLFYRDGLILAAAGPVERYVLAMGIVVTAVYLVGLIRRSTTTIGRLGLDSVVVAAAYALTLAGLYLLQ